MFKTFYQDREKIENKYHKKGDPNFDGYRRRDYHGYEFDESTGLSDEQLIQGLEELSIKNDKLPHPIAKAKAIEYMLNNIRIDINESDYFVGFWSRGRLIVNTTMRKWSKELFLGKLAETDELMTEHIMSGSVDIWPDYDHVVPDWESLFSLGFFGIRERARKYRLMHEKDGTMTEEMFAHFEGIEIEYTAILSVLDRLYQLSKKQTHEKAEKVSLCLQHLCEGAPTNIYEAMQLIYIYFIISDCIDLYQVRSLGHGLDNSLYPFYVNDIKNGTYTQEEIKELLAYFLIQWSAIKNIMGQPFYIGGTLKNGESAVNQLTYDILDVYDELGIYDPKIQVKVNYNSPDKYIFKVLDMIRRGHNSLVFCCEPGMKKAVMSYGATEEEARTMDIRGCYETGVRANEVATGTGYVNAVKAVEYALTNGLDKRIKKQIGIKTGELKDFKTFDDFYYAVIKQWTHLIENTIKMANAYEPYLSWVNPSSMYSATIEGSLKKGVDAYQCGVKFNNSTILNCAFANLVNSLMAIKEFVYDKKETTLREIVEALDNDWVNYEQLQIKILKSPHKYGNNDKETDVYAVALARYFANRVNNRPNARGGVYKAIMHSSYQFVWQGEKTLATPDGRKAGMELSKNGTPAPGTDKRGVTALIASIAKINPSLYPESFGLDIMLHPSVTQGEDGMIAMKAILDIYMKNDGMSIQFNVFNTEMLRDAQKHPENYKTLQVRVCGWNSYWNDLSKKEQDAYILRSENIQN